MHKTRALLAVVGACVVGLVAAPHALAAGTSGRYNAGTFVNTHVPDPTSGNQSAPCVGYRDWRSVGELPPDPPVSGNKVTITNGTPATYDGPLTTLTTSNPGTYWWEGPPGTYDSVACTGPGDVISGFTAEVRGNDEEGSVRCFKDGNSSAGTYTRNGVNIDLVFDDYTCRVTEGTNTKTDIDVMIHFDMELVRLANLTTACDRPIAPDMCLATGSVIFTDS